MVSYFQNSYAIRRLAQPSSSPGHIMFKVIPSGYVKIAIENGH